MTERDYLFLLLQNWLSMHRGASARRSERCARSYWCWRSELCVSMVRAAPWPPWNVSENSVVCLLFLAQFWRWTSALRHTAATTTLYARSRLFTCLQEVSSAAHSGVVVSGNHTPPLPSKPSSRAHRNTITWHLLHCASRCGRAPRLNKRTHNGPGAPIADTGTSARTSASRLSTFHALLPLSNCRRR